METVRPASTKARVALAVLVIIVLLVVLLVGNFSDRLGEWVVEDEDKLLERVTTLINWFAILQLPLLAFGVLTFRSGSRVIESERYPPAGMWVVVDTPVETGPRARMRGKLYRFAGLSMCAIAIGSPILVWYIVHSVVGVA